MNLRVNRAPIYISRHGESQHNVLGLIGGDSELSPQGLRYAKALAKFIEEEDEFRGPRAEQLTVWTSTMRRTIQTASFFHLPITQWRALIEIQCGLCDNMTYEEIAERFPAEADARKKDKLRYRYPQGESYLDVIQRLEPCILELERMQSPVLLIVHRAVARCLLSYFMDIDPNQIPHLEVPLHTVMKLQPKAYQCQGQSSSAAPPAAAAAVSQPAWHSKAAAADACSSSCLCAADLLGSDHIHLPHPFCGSADAEGDVSRAACHCRQYSHPR